MQECGMHLIMIKIYKIVLLLSLTVQVFIKVSLKTVYDGKMSEDIIFRNVVIPWRSNRNGDFLTYTIPCYPNRTVCPNCNDTLLYYKLNIQGEDTLIELKPNINMFSKASHGEVYHSKNNRNHKKQSKLNILANDHCQYYGIVRNKPNSSVALSNCAGLMGYIKLNHDYYMIEPMDITNNTNLGQLHTLYQHNYSPHPVLDFPLHSRNARMRKKQGYKRSLLKRSVSDPGYLKQMYLETLVVLDKTLIDFHKSLDLDNYVLTVMNMAHTLFRDNSFGAPMELVIVRMISLEQEDEAINLEKTKDAPRVLEAFQAWAHRVNPALDSHPHHHDVAILITRVDLCLTEDMSSCGLMGLAHLATVCNPEEQAVLVEDTGLVLGFTIAHEIGHALGMEHDGLEESGCESSPYGDGYSVIMAKEVSMRLRGWSSCSREYLWTFIDAGLGSCLYDKPADHHIPEDMLPGTMYGVAFQCQSLIDHTVTDCPDVGVECSNMKCWIPEYGCVDTHRPLAEGTECAPHMWCFAGRCLAAGQRPEARDGGWGNWGEWSECSRSCGSGVRQASRSCDNPRPENRGFYCKGQRVKYQVCNTQACSFNSESFRNVQCADYNEWVYPEDGHTHTWTSYIATSESPCALICVNEKKQVALLKSVVTDGTPCFFGPGHICVAGQCKSVPCDGEFDSGAVEDACGVCRGPGTSCKLKTEQKTITKHSKPQLIVAVPKNAQFATFEELSPTKARFLVRSGPRTLVSGNKFGITPVDKMIIWLGYVRHQQEILRITGPVTENVHIYNPMGSKSWDPSGRRDSFQLLHWSSYIELPLQTEKAGSTQRLNKYTCVFSRHIHEMQASEEVTIQYTIAERVTGHTGSYSWQHTEWNECSSECGPGTSSSIAECIETLNGLVDNKYCSEVVPKPDALTRPCELRKCEARWQVGEWSGCDCSCSDDSVDERSVLCVLSHGNGQDDHVVADKLCLPPKPQFEKPCNCPPHPSSRPGRKIQMKTMKGKIKNWVEKSKKVKKKTKNKFKKIYHNGCENDSTKKNSSVSKILDKSHLKNVKLMEREKGKLIQDYQNLNKFELTLEIDDEKVIQQDKRLEYQEFPKQHKTDHKASVHGKAAVKVIQQLQVHHHHHK